MSIRESQIRDELLELAVRDLLGPAGGPDEELSLDAEYGRLMKPTDRYLLGMLAPRDTAVPETEINRPVPPSQEDESEPAVEDVAPHNLSAGGPAGVKGEEL